MLNYYQILGVAEDASPEEIKQAYRKLSQKMHPDKNDGDTYFSELFKNINEANEILSDPQKKSDYDLKFRQEQEYERDVKLKAEELAMRERELAEQEEKLNRLRQQSERKQHMASEKKIVEKENLKKIFEETTVARKTDHRIKARVPWGTLIFLLILAAVGYYIFRQSDKSVVTDTPNIYTEKPGKPTPTHFKAAKKSKSSDVFSNEEKKQEEIMEEKHRLKEQQPEADSAASSL